MKNYVANVLINGRDCFNGKQVNVVETDDSLDILEISTNSVNRILTIMSGRDQLLNLLKETETRVLSAEITTDINGTKFIDVKYVNGTGEWEMTNSAEIREKYQEGLTFDQINETTQCYSIWRERIHFTKITAGVRRC